MGEVDRGEAPYLVLGDVEVDAGGDVGHGADGDGDFFASEEVSLLEKYVGDVVFHATHDESVDLADLPVGGVDLVASVHGYFAGGHRISGDGLLSDIRREDV